MVYIRRFIGLAAAFSTLNVAVALPQPGSDLSQQDGYGSSKDNNNYGSSSGYDSSKDSNKGSYNSGYGSSNDNSGYGSSNNSGYGSSNNSGYGSSNNSGYGSSNNNGYSSSKDSKTSTSSSMMSESTSTMMVESTSTTEAPAASSTSVMYGSGSMNSGSGSYNDCVQQCIASFSPSSTASSVNSGSSGSSDNSAGSGATKTVIVAPTQGVLRYSPFAVNASVGDYIKFVWGAGPHTVTKGSALQPCNATSDSPFTSDKQNVGFEFMQKVTTTDPTFFFCTVPNHCQKGMFGVINPASNLNAPTSASGMMQSLKANNSDLKTYAALTDAATSGKPAALWGGSIDMASLPDWAQPLAAENILYTRNLIASNPEILKEDGTIDMSNADTTPMMYPKDVSDAIKDAAAASTPTASPSGGSTAPANVAGAVTTSANPAPTSGAGLTTPRAVLALVAVGATVLML